MLLLDNEALSAIANGPAQRRDRVRALIVEARRDERTVATVAVVIAETIRGRRADAAVFSVLGRESVKIETVDARVGVRAGRLLGATRRGSEHAVDACIVAVGDLAGGAIVATVDTDDLETLASHAKDVVVVSIQPEG